MAAPSSTQPAGIFSRIAGCVHEGTLSAVPRLGEMAGTEAPKRAAGRRRGRISARRRTADAPGREPDGAFRHQGGILSARSGDFTRWKAFVSSVRRGETLSLVGESGCGKSRPQGALEPCPVDGRHPRRRRSTHGLRGSSCDPSCATSQMIFQDPYASLDPRMRVLRSGGRAMVIPRLASGKRAAVTGWSIFQAGSDCRPSR